MNEELLNKAIEQVEDVRLLINVAPKRAAQIARGGKPLVHMTPGEEVEFLDIALQEVAEGKIVITAGDESESATFEENLEDTSGEAASSEEGSEEAGETAEESEEAEETEPSPASEQAEATGEADKSDDAEGTEETEEGEKSTEQSPQ